MRTEAVINLDWFTHQMGKALQDTLGVLVSPIRQDEEAGEGMCTAEVVFERPTGRETIRVILALGKIPDRPAKEALRTQAEASLDEMVDYLSHRVTVHYFYTVTDFERYLAYYTASTTH